MDGTWIEVRVITKSEALEPVSGIFYSLDCKGVAIEDPEDILGREQGPLTWDFADINVLEHKGKFAVVKAYFAEEDNIEEILGYVNEKLVELKEMGIDLGEAKVEHEKMHEEDWANTWKQYYKPSKVGEKIVVKPIWEEYEQKEGELVVNLDPGMAFGTGTHETTRMCIKALEKYVKEDIKRPDISYLHMNPDYKLLSYEAPNMKSYIPQDKTFNFDGEFYGIAFGNLGTNNFSLDGYRANKIDDYYLVGQYGEKNFGTLCSTNDGLCGMFRQISIKDNFTIEAEATIIDVNYVDQAGFGIMLRDDLYLNQKAAKEVIASNYITSGVITNAKSYVINYKRESTTEITRSSNVVHHPYFKGDKFKLYLNRLGQRVIVRVSNEEFSYENEYLDFDLQAHDFNNMYVGLFATNGTIVKYSNINFKITGNAKEA